jgi:urease accessory protein
MLRLLVAALALVPTAAMAHPGLTGHSHDLTQGFAHPFSGLDHVLAMVAVGLLAVQLSGRALWQVPPAFVVTMAAAGALGMAGVGIPYVETGIALSILVLGAVVALRVGMPVVIAMAMVAVFAVFHGYAHGAEMAAGEGAASSLLYGVGFIAATLLLHGVGIAAGLLIARMPQGLRVAQIAGGAMALAGAVLLVSA